ncbi:MAG: addiction module protein [Cyanobium sp.]
MKASDLSYMSSSLYQIEEQARSLSAEDRAKLAEFMLESLQTSIEEIEEAWSEEIALRIDAFEKGDISAYSAEQVFAEARQILQ